MGSKALSFGAGVFAIALLAIIVWVIVFSYYMVSEAVRWVFTKSGEKPKGVRK